VAASEKKSKAEATAKPRQQQRANSKGNSTDSQSEADFKRGICPLLEGVEGESLQQRQRGQQHELARKVTKHLF